MVFGYVWAINSPSSHLDGKVVSELSFNRTTIQRFMSGIKGAFWVILSRSETYIEHNLYSCQLIIMFGL